MGASFVKEIVANCDAADELRWGRYKELGCPLEFF